MKIVLAPNAFKGSLSAFDVCRAMKIGARRVYPDAEILSLPLAHGGAGTLEALTCHKAAIIKAAIIKTQTVRGPLGAPVQANWAILIDDGRAIIEVAQASGLNLTEPKERDVLRASTFGTGQLIQAAIKSFHLISSYRNAKLNFSSKQNFSCKKKGTQLFYCER